MVCISKETLVLFLVLFLAVLIIAVRVIRQEYFSREGRERRHREKALKEVKQRILDAMVSLGKSQFTLLELLREAKFAGSVSRITEALPTLPNKSVAFQTFLPRYVKDGISALRWEGKLATDDWWVFTAQ